MLSARERQRYTTNDVVFGCVYCRSARSLRLLSGLRGIAVPFDSIANMNDTADEHLGENTTPPIRAQRCLQPWCRFIHALARRQLASDRKSRISNCQDATSCVGEPDSAEKDIRPAQRWILVDAKLVHARNPRLGFEQRHLPASASINTARHTLTCDQRRLRHAVHWPAMRALDPDSFDAAGDRLTLETHAPHHFAISRVLPDRIESRMCPQHDQSR